MIFPGINKISAGSRIFKLAPRHALFFTNKRPRYYIVLSRWERNERRVRDGKVFWLNEKKKKNIRLFANASTTHEEKVQKVEYSVSNINIKEME